MNSSRLIILLLFMFKIIILFSTESAAHDTGGLFAEMFTPSLYEDQSAFTLIPATVGEITLSIPAFLIGGTVYLAGYTIGLPFDKEDEFSALGIYTGFGVFRLGGYTAGAPFYAIEKTFYDIPVLIYSRDEEDSSKSKPIGILKEHHPVVETKSLGKTPPNQSQDRKIIKIEKVHFNDCMPKPTMGAGKSVILTGHSLQFTSGYCNEKNARITKRSTGQP